jgi:Fe-S-cluster-containing dehydrogenase component
MTFGNSNNPESRVSKLREDERRFRVFESLGTDPNVVYLKQVDTNGA